MLSIALAWAVSAPALAFPPTDLATRNAMRALGVREADFDRDDAAKTIRSRFWASWSRVKALYDPSLHPDKPTVEGAWIAHFGRMRELYATIRSGNGRVSHAEGLRDFDTDAGKGLVWGDLRTGQPLSESTVMSEQIEAAYRAEFPEGSGGSILERLGRGLRIAGEVELDFRRSWYAMSLLPRHAVPEIARFVPSTSGAAWRKVDSKSAVETPTALADFFRRNAHRALERSVWKDAVRTVKVRPGVGMGALDFGSAPIDETAASAIRNFLRSEWAPEADFEYADLRPDFWEAFRTSAVPEFAQRGRWLLSHIALYRTMQLRMGIPIVPADRSRWLLAWIATDRTRGSIGSTLDEFFRATLPPDPDDGQILMAIAILEELQHAIDGALTNRRPLDRASALPALVAAYASHRNRLLDRLGSVRPGTLAEMRPVWNGGIFRSRTLSHDGGRSLPESLREHLDRFVREDRALFANEFESALSPSLAARSGAAGGSRETAIIDAALRTSRSSPNGGLVTIWASGHPLRGERDRCLDWTRKSFDYVRWFSMN